MRKEKTGKEYATYTMGPKNTGIACTDFSNLEYRAWPLRVGTRSVYQRLT